MPRDLSLCCNDPLLAASTPVDFILFLISVAGNDFLCRSVKYLQVMVMYLSTYVLVMTAVDRYVHTRLRQCE